MSIVDAHVHVVERYAPLKPFADLGRLDRLLYLMDECNVDKAIMVPVVTPASPDNNAQCATWAREHPDRLATLTNVQLEEKDATDQIVRARQQYNAVGISYYPPTHDLSWLLEPSCDSMWSQLEGNELVCNLQITAPNYPVLLRLGRRHKQITFVANHLGLPSSLPADDTDYGGLLTAAEIPNILLKASAFYDIAAKAWDPHCPKAMEYFHRLVNNLGPDRLMWGTDWPAAGRHLTYRQALEQVRTVSDLDAVNLGLILGGNAARIYGI